MTSRPETRPPAFAVLPLALVALALAALVPEMAAAQESGRASFDLFGSYLRRDVFDDEAFGVRGGYRLAERWAIEGTLERVATNTAVSLADVSLKAYLASRDHLSFYVLGGGGALDGPGNVDATLHLGTGLELGLGEHAYLRPEARARWFTENRRADPLLDYSLGFGWRF